MKTIRRALAALCLIALLLCAAPAAHAALPRGVIVSGQAYVCSGYANGWMPLFFAPLPGEVQSDPGDWLYATKLSTSQAQFGRNTVHTGPLTAWTRDGLLTSFLGSQVIQFEFDVYPSDNLASVLSPLYRLEVWGSTSLWYPDLDIPRTRWWSSSGPWTTPAQHVFVDNIPGLWWYEFRLVVVPEPTSLVIVAFPLVLMCLVRRPGMR